MFIQRFLKRNWFPITIFIFAVALLLFLFEENFVRGIVIFLSLLLWLCIAIKTKKFFLSSILYILVVLPLNITYQFPTHVLFFTTQPYVDGLYSNYLVPTLSIIDAGIVLLIVSYIYEFGFKHVKVILKKYFLIILLLATFLLGYSLIQKDLLSLLNGTRLVMAMVGFVFLIDYFKTQKHFEIYKYTMVISFLLVLFQGIVGIIQFAQGSSLGIGFLGESQVVSGMQGSSFVTLNNEVFLRAYGTFPHPNLLAGYFIMNILLGIYLYARLNGVFKWLSIAVVCLSSVFVIFTFSRICILLVILILLVMWLYKSAKGRLFSFAPILLFERFMNLVTGGDTSFADRINLMRCSFKIIKERWLFGTGLGNFTKYMDGIVPRTANDVLLLQPVHSVPLLMVSEMGVVGTLLYLFFLIKIWIENRGKMNVFKWLVIMCLVVIGCFDHYLFSLPQGMVMGGILFILFVL